MQEKKQADSNRIEEDQQGWNIHEIADEASQKDDDEIQRQTLRGDETKGDPDDRDHAGSVALNETPQGREETKNDRPGKANTNG